MKFFFFLCLAINLTYVSSCKLYELNSIVGRVTEIDFDSSLTTYVSSEASTIPGSNFVKLDSQNNYVFGKHVKGTTSSIVDVNDNFYLFVHHLEKGTNVLDGNGSMWRLRSYSNELQLMFTFIWPDNPVYYKQFVEKGGNVIFNTKSGVSFWRPGRHIPRTIANLKNYFFYDHAIDEEGNIYLAVRLSGWKFLAILTKKQLDQYSPEVKVLADVGDPDSLTYWHNSIIMTEFQNSVGSIRLLKNGSSEVLISEYGVSYGTWLNKDLIPTNDRLYVIGINNYEEHNNLYYINKTFEVVKIEENLSKYEKHSPFTDGYAFSKSGIAYFSNYDEERDDHHLLYLKPNDTKFSEIKIPTDRPIMDLQMDKDDNLWLLADYLYVVKNNTDKPIQASDYYFSSSIFSHLKIKPNNDVYIYNFLKFYVCTDNDIKAKPKTTFYPGNPKKEVDTKDIDEYSSNFDDYEKEGMSTTTIVIIVIVVIVILVLIVLACSGTGMGGCCCAGSGDCDCDCDFD